MRKSSLAVAGAVLVAVSISRMTLRRVAAAGPQPAPAPAVQPELDHGPRALRPVDVGVGRLVPDVVLPDLAGKAVPLSRLKGPRGLVVALVSSSCPAGKRFAPALGRIEAEYAARGIPFAYVATLAADSPADLRSMARSAGLRGPLLRDPKRELCAALEAGTTTEVFVLDAARTLVYRGAVSDQYGPTWSLDAPRRSFLTEALDALLAETAPKVAATTAPGCALQTVALQSSAKPAAVPTYQARISRVVQTHCLECHHAGGIAPFSLETAADVTSHAGMIDRVVAAGRMPPWFAAPPEAGQPSKWANDRTMPAADKADLLAWVRGTKPLGNPADAPAPRRYDPTWLIGKPDVVFQVAEPVAVQAEGTMPYVTLDVETGLTEDKWVQSIEIAPTDRSVVHHVLVSVRPGNAGAGGGGPFSRLREEIGGFFGVYVPGNSTLVYPDGFAKKIPAGSKLHFQIHYTPNGKATTDRTRIAFKFAKNPPEHEVRVAGIANPLLNIPPGAADHPETAYLPVPMNARVMAFLPHMHLRGKAAKYELVGADGNRQTLLDVPRYDFNWQLYYRLAEPALVKAGSRIEFTGRFDNSAGNPANPDPAKRVRWGAQTYDEMLLGYVEYYVDGPEGAAGAGLRAGLGGAGQGQGLEALFKRVDRNGDGKVTPDELPNETLFKRLDTNGDGVITLEEARANFPLTRR